MGSIGPLELLVLLVVGLAFPVAFVASLVWAYRDGEARGQSGLLVAVLVAVGAWPLGLLAWLFIRPDPADG